MLEIKNLSKIYKPKKGVPVTALKGISLKLPDTGMIFLLGKSGSGKSTLLNLLGGLDSYDSGEIIINGVSSKNFKQRHFDSYRNTYVGFIFQEYNVLDEFNVGENIAIAIELQGKKATDQEINRILTQVDLEGYGNRKPNELSGGQKQRVAIARALVKNPEIIMADEPTGALDSNTGRQVLDTLKKLSKEKLIVVVSHDREFAENYADRIIELADGEIINDLTVDNDMCEQEAENLAFSEDCVTVKSGYHLTEEDLKRINEYIDSVKSGNFKLSVSESKNSKFKNTDTQKITSNTARSFKPIKSKLPMRNAFKMGASGLKHKKFRLVITILLSCIALGLFGLADTFAAYNHIKVCTNSIYDSGVDYATVIKSRRYGDDWYDYKNYLSEKDLADIKANTGVSLNGVFYPKSADLSFLGNINTESETSESEYEIYYPSFSGYTEIASETLDEFGYKLVAGKLPDGTKNEIAVSKYIFEVFKKTQYTDGVPVKDAKGIETLVYNDIKNYSDLLDKTITLNGTKYVVTGIVDTNFDLTRYEGLIKKKENQTSAQKIIDYALVNEFNSHRSYSMASMIMLGSGSLDKMIEAQPPIYDINKGYLWFNGANLDIDPNYLTTIDKIDTSGIEWVNGAKTALSEKEIIVFADTVNFWHTENVAQKEDGGTDYLKTFKKNNSVVLNKFGFGAGKNSDEDGYTVVGVIPNNEKYKNLNGTVVVTEGLLNRFSVVDDGKYTSAVGVMPSGIEEIRTLVSYCYNTEDNLRYPLQNAATFELDMINEELKEFAKVFLYIGLGFALFAAVMLANFIGTSISHKKQEIGILRAIGSRSNDVFRIFFAESFIIAMINFLLSSIGVGVITFIINYVIRNQLGILITILTFNLRQILLLFAVSLLVAFVASYLPVKRIASKRPIDAIRDR